ncbi:MAG: DNA-protecting protein DprA [Ignavibacteriae bacterium]|nr:DNA-protecting protein DprA [Ignavibacteriota bacterium]
MSVPVSISWKFEDILALSFVRGLTAVTLRSLVEKYSSLEELFEKPPETKVGQRLLQNDLFVNSGLNALRNEADKQIELCRRQAIQIISFWDNDYPDLLRQIPFPPALLFVRGKLHSDKDSIGIVGTRLCTNYGKLTTERFAEIFAKNSVIVTSGLANGIDSIAHKTVVNTGGITYAIIASGIDCISPQLSAKLAQQISENGAVISEYRCGIRALPAYFPQRNRIISGLSRAVVVVESGLKGGALITAQFAADQSRELFAVPGSITSEKSLGTNKLIRKNMAIIALSPEDVLEELGILSIAKPTKEAVTFNHEIEKRIYETISFEPIQMDTLAELLKLSPQDIMVNLLMLEFRGLIRQLAGKQFIRL